MTGHHAFLLPQSYDEIMRIISRQSMRGSSGGGGSGPPTMKNHKNIEFLSNTGPDALKTTKLPGQHSLF